MIRAMPGKIPWYIHVAKIREWDGVKNEQLLVAHPSKWFYRTSSLERGSSSVIPEFC